MGLWHTEADRLTVRVPHDESERWGPRAILGARTLRPQSSQGRWIVLFSKKESNFPFTVNTTRTISKQGKMNRTSAERTKPYCPVIRPRTQTWDSRD